MKMQRRKRHYVNGVKTMGLKLNLGCQDSYRPIDAQVKTRSTRKGTGGQSPICQGG